jgi:hypothetical protein
MTLCKTLTALIPTLALSALAVGSLGIGAVAVAVDAPPPSSAPGNGEPNGRHHNPAWAACKKQADDQKLDPGEARRDFMKDCMKSAKDSVPPAAS